VRARTNHANGLRTTRWRALLAFAGALGLHLAVFIGLLHGPDTATVRWRPQPASVTVDLLEPPPVLETASALQAEPPPPLPPPAIALIEKRPAAAPAQMAPAKSLPVAPVATATPADLPAPVSFSLRLSQQRSDVAAQIARENAPARRPFRERDLGAMVPGAGNGKLPGFRPRFGTPSGDLARSVGRMLEQKLPTAAVEWDAPLDPLTERWEAAHHGSDLAACERQYEDVDRELRRQLCGEVRPPD
jgi:hypothetical protein